MSQFLEKIKRYLDFLQGPSYLLFMSEAGRCEYLIFSAVHLATVVALGWEKGIDIKIDIPDHVKALAQCYYQYFTEGKMSKQEKCRIENKILSCHIKEHLHITHFSHEKFRQWKKRALEKDPIAGLEKIMKHIR